MSVNDDDRGSSSASREPRFREGEKVRLPSASLANGGVQDTPALVLKVEPVLSREGRLYDYAYTLKLPNGARIRLLEQHIELALREWQTTSDSSLAAEGRWVGWCGICGAARFAAQCRQEERDEVCIYVCRVCGSVVSESGLPI